MRFLDGLRPIILFCLILGAVALLAGCGDPPSTPRPLEPTATVAEPTAVADIRPSGTALPEPSATSTPSRTPTPSVTPTNTTTPTPTPTPTPTVPPSALLEEAGRHQHNGEYALAIDLYLTLLEEATQPPDHVREARYRLAETYLRNRD